MVKPQLVYEMKDEERDEFTERSNALRQELKVWEKSFSVSHGGRKAGRDDIKKNPDIGTRP